jgi:hypothetical protein
MTIDGKLPNRQNGDGKDEVKDRDDSVRIFRLTDEQFEAAMKAGRIGEAEEILDEEQDHSEPPKPLAQDDGAIAQKEDAVRVSKNAGQKTIIDTVADFLRRFVFLQDETYYRLIAAWIVATYLHKTFEYLGYLFVYSPERRSGKTTLLEILNMLVYEPTGLQISPTEAVMFRTAEGHTHLLDEVDSWKNKDDLKDVLNAGYKKGGIVIRCEKGKGAFKPTRFPVFAPRALAGIGLSILHSTTLDRTFAVPIVRRKKEEKKERSRERIIGPQAKALKQAIERWVREHEKLVADVYDQADFPYLESFSDRTIDIAEPLAAIVEVAYKGTPEAKQAQKDLVHAIASTRKEQQSASNDHVLLKHLLSLTDIEDPLVGSATELAANCANLETPADAFTVSRVLRNYSFKTKSIRKDGEKPAYRYSLSKAALKEVVERWTSDLETASAETPEERPLDGGGSACNSQL